MLLAVLVVEGDVFCCRQSCTYWSVMVSLPSVAPARMSRMLSSLRASPPEKRKSAPGLPDFDFAFAQFDRCAGRGPAASAGRLSSIGRRM